MNIKIHGASSLALQGIYPKWILASDIIKVDTASYCKTAMAVDIEFLQDVIPKEFLEKYRLLDLNNKKSPVYHNI